MRFGTSNSPSALALTTRSPVWPLTVTLAFAMAAPDGSRTRPLIVPLVTKSWAEAVNTSAIVQHNKRKVFLSLLDNDLCFICQVPFLIDLFRFGNTTRAPASGRETRIEH